MSTELRQFNYAQELYLTSLTGAYRRSKIRYPSLWSGRDPDICSKKKQGAVRRHRPFFRDPQALRRAGMICCAIPANSR